MIGRQVGQSRQWNGKKWTYSEKDPHRRPSLLQLIDVSNYTSSNAETYTRSESLNEATYEEGGEVACECDA